MRTVSVLVVAAAATLSFSPAADAAKPVRHMVSCVAEDGGPVLPCVWDGKHRGNGKGKSFVVRKNGDIDYVTPRRAHKLAR